MNPLIVIPSRLKATRLPNKPLALIAGEPMIAHVWRRAVAAGVGPVVVAAGDQEIVDIITGLGGSAVLTDPALPSGSDRVHAAAEKVDPDHDFDVIINLQGDLPTLDPAILQAVLKPLAVPAVDIATLANEFHDETDARNDADVKIVLALRDNDTLGRCLYFSREPVPWGEARRWHHIGIYAYRRTSLARFITLPVHPLEEAEKLEQLRALADGMRIDAAIVHSTPFGVDTPADLEKARAVIGKSN